MSGGAVGASAVPLLAALGFNIDALIEGRSPLHHVAAGGQLDMVGLLLDLGADPRRRDQQFGADVFGWADHFRQDAVRQLLDRWEGP